MVYVYKLVFILSVLTNCTKSECPEHCSICTSHNICTKCDSSHYLVHDRCPFCPDRCSHCNGHNCDSCIAGRYGDQCRFYCLTNCETCQIDDGACTRCKSGLYGQFCQNDCSRCKGGLCDLQACIHGCKPGYFETRGSVSKNCRPCSANCARCNSYSKCNVCNNGFYLVVYSANSAYCRPCTTNVPSCQNSCDMENCKSCKFWGHFCNKPCSMGCVANTSRLRLCNREDGKCTDGCKEGFIGERCDTAVTMKPSTNDPYRGPEEESDTFKTTTLSPKANASASFEENAEAPIQNDGHKILIIGLVAGGGALLLIIIFILILCFVKRRRNPDGKDKAKTNALPLKTEPVQENHDYIYALPNKQHKRQGLDKQEIGESQRVCSNIARHLDVDQEEVEETNVCDIELDELGEESTGSFIVEEVEIPTSDTYYNTASLIRSRIQVSNLLEYIKTKTDFKKEFEKLPMGLTRTCNEALKPNNRAKNRYNGIYAYDATRVVLQSGQFVNANFVDGHTQNSAYIASLGPTKTTMKNFETFWEMVWQERTNKIIMLTKLKEAKKMKCEQYWPRQGTHITCGDYKVSCTAEKIFSEFILREHAVTRGINTRKVTQFHYTAWPDKTVPDSVASLIEFRDKVEQTQIESTGPMVVHCSAGIGRTGTYIALDILIKEGKEENYVDIFSCVNALRGQRVQMVQNSEQYVYLHHCLLYALTCDTVPLPVTAVPHYMRDERISKQYEAFVNLQQLTNNGTILKTNIKDKKEIRKGADTPGEEHRDLLTFKKRDHINAVYLNGYLKEDRFIVSQTPLPNTVEDFVSMLYQERCTCVVCLDEENIKDKSVAQYLPPANKVSKFGYFQVACLKSDQRPDFVIRELKISRIGSPLSEELSIFHYQFNGWSRSDSVPPRTQTFLNMVIDVDKTTHRLNCEKPIVVHCSTGAERSGIFCAVSILREKVGVEKELSVLNTICQVCARRRSAFRDIEHLRFCYSCVEEVLKMSDTNYNIKHV